MGQAHNLSKEQLQDLSSRINNPDIGGFSIKSHGPEAGSPPNNSFMVGISKHGQNKMPLPVAPSEIGNFATSRGSALSQDDKYLGGWIGNGEGASLDVSQAHPISKGMTPAMFQAYINKEKAIGMVGAGGKYITDIPTENPINTLTRATGERIGTGAGSQKERFNAIRSTLGR